MGERQVYTMFRLGDVCAFCGMQLIRGTHTYLRNFDLFKYTFFSTHICYFISWNETLAKAGVAFSLVLTFQFI